MPRVKKAFVREDTSVSPKAEEIYDEYLELSDRVAKVSESAVCMSSLQDGLTGNGKN